MTEAEVTRPDVSTSSHDSSQPYGKLLAAVSGAVVPVGAGGQFRAPRTGTIALRINDIDQCLVDNDGVGRVEIVAP